MSLIGGVGLVKTLIVTMSPFLLFFFILNSSLRIEFINAAVDKTSPIGFKDAIGFGYLEAYF